MDLKFKEFGELIFIAESRAIVEGFIQSDPSLKEMYIRWLESKDDEKQQFAEDKLKQAEEWYEQAGEIIKALKGDK